MNKAIAIPLKKAAPMLRSLLYFLVGTMGLSIAITVFGIFAKGREYTIEELYEETRINAEAASQ